MIQERGPPESLTFIVMAMRHTSYSVPIEMIPTTTVTSLTRSDCSVVSGAVSGVVSDVVSGVVSGAVSGAVSGVVSGAVSGAVSGVVSGTVIAH